VTVSTSSPANPAPAHAPGTTEQPPSPPPGGRTARLIVVLCFAIATVATTLIYWRWANVSEPTSYVIIEGAEEFGGTVITVSTERNGDVVAMQTLSAENQYGVTIFLHPGTYWLHAAQGGTTLIEGNMLVAHRSFKTIQLRALKRPPGDRPTAAGVS
jgi:hypothetical protein